MSGDTFRCPYCSATYPFSPELAGKTARCKCGKFFEVNAEQPAPVATPATDDYDLVEEETPLPPMPQTVAAAPKIKVPMVQSFPVPRHSSRPQEADIDDGPPAWKTLYAPLCLLICGVAIWIAGGLLTQTAGDSGVHAILSMGVLLVANIIVMLIGGAIAGSLLGVEFGPMGRVAFQFTAMAVFTSAVAIVVVQFDRSQSMVGPLVAWHLVLIIYWTCFSLFFDLEFQETMLSVSTIAILQAILMCVMLNIK